VVGGIGGAAIQSVQLIESFPSSSTIWTAEGVVNTTMTGGNKMTVTAYVVCSS
jgi:hypothetical protein